MIYRETGQFKTTYASDQQLFPILQDRVFVIAALAFAFVAVPFLASDYLFRAILTPFLILALAALGLNILVGYCGQVSLGTGGFTSIPGAIVGGLLIGLGEKLSEVYLGPAFGGGIEGWFGYVLALAFLLFRPEGLFGEKIIDRV